jgi:hypothetical protein
VKRFRNFFSTPFVPLSPLSSTVLCPTGELPNDKRVEHPKLLTPPWISRKQKSFPRFKMISQLIEDKKISYDAPMLKSVEERGLHRSYITRRCTRLYRKMNSLSCDYGSSASGGKHSGTHHFVYLLIKVIFLCTC